MDGKVKEDGMSEQIPLGGFRVELPKAKCSFCNKRLTKKRGWGGDSAGEYYHSDCYEAQLNYLMKFGRLKRSL